MKTIIKKIYTILVLVKNLLIRHKHYKLSFFGEYNTILHKTRWYYDFKHWGFSKSNLEMVSGADTLCTNYALGKNYLTVNIIASKKQLDENKIQNYDMYAGEPINNIPLKEKLKLQHLLYGRTYTNVTVNDEGELEVKKMWICPVTLFVLGRYPNYIYIQK